MNDDTPRTDASPSRSAATPRSGFVTTAAGTVGSQNLAPLNANNIRVLSDRGLDVERLVMLGVGGSDRLHGNCIGIPYIERGVRVQTKYRTLDVDKRFTQDVGGKSVLWNGDCLLDDTLAHHPVIITEGELDAASALQAGYQRVVSVPSGAPPSATDGMGTRYAFVEEMLARTKRCREFILAVDGDDKGACLLHDLALRIGRARCKFVTYPRGTKDLNDVLREKAEQGVRDVITTAQWMPVSGVYTLDQLPPTPHQEAFSTGMVGMDDHYKVRRGDFVVVTGIPGHGKTSFVTEVCCRLAFEKKLRIALASFENDNDDALRALRSFHGQRLVKDMTADQIAAANEWIASQFVFVRPVEDDDNTMIDLDWMMDRAAACYMRHDIDVLVIDPWNELDHVRPPDVTLTEYVGLAIRRIRRFAKTFAVHVIVVAHPAKMQRGKDGKTPRPSLYDISDSAHWANKPDLAIVVHREDFTNNVTEIAVVKSRNVRRIGRPGTVKAIWDDERTRYTIADEAKLV